MKSPTTSATRKSTSLAKSTRGAKSATSKTTKPGVGRSTKTMRKVHKSSGSTKVAGTGETFKKVKKVKKVKKAKDMQKFAKTAKTGAKSARYLKAGVAGAGGGLVAGSAISAGFLAADLVEQELNDPGKTWRDLKSGNIAKSTIYDTVDIIPGGMLITTTAKIIDQETTDPGKTMRDINSGLDTIGDAVDRVGLGVNKTLGLSANPGDSHVLDYVNPIGAGLAIRRDLKSGRIQSDLRKTQADIKKVGTDIDRHANGVKNDVKKATASVGKKVDGVIKGIFK